MDIRKIKFGKDGKPSDITVRMSVDEAGSIAKIFGKYSPSKYAEEFPNQPDGISSEIYDCLVGKFFNVFYYAGVDDWMRGKAPDDGYGL